MSVLFGHLGGAGERLVVGIRVERRAAADEVAVAVHVVDAPHGGPELAGLDPGGGVGGLLAEKTWTPEGSVKGRSGMG